MGFHVSSGIGHCIPILCKIDCAWVSIKFVAMWYFSKLRYVRKTRVHFDFFDIFMKYLYHLPFCMSWAIMTAISKSVPLYHWYIVALWESSLDMYMVWAINIYPDERHDGLAPSHYLIEWWYFYWRIFGPLHRNGPEMSVAIAVSIDFSVKEICDFSKSC